MLTESKETSGGVANKNEKYLPYSHNLLTDSMKEWAEKVWGETPEVVKRSLEELRAILREEEPNLRFRDEDIFLLNFLRVRKFDVRRAVSMIKRFYSYMDSHAELFRRKPNPEVVEKAIKRNAVGFLPYRDEKNRAIVVLRAEAWDPDEIDAEDMAYGTIVSMKSAIDNPVNQVMGLVAICDLKNLSTRQVWSLAPKYLLLATRGLQYTCPCKVSAMHVVNLPPIYKMGWKLVKPLLSEKIKKRIVFHKDDTIASLHKYMPPSILPTEFGGDLGPFDNSHWGKDTQKILASYYEELKYGYVKNDENDGPSQ